MEPDGVSETEMVGTDVVLECAGEESGTLIVGTGATEGRVGI